MQRPFGMAEEAFRAWIQACMDAGVSRTRVGQTIGDAPASMGTHAQDGEIGGHPYSAAVDIKIRDLSGAQIVALQEALWKNGFAAWHRRPPVFASPHIHAIYCNLPMKELLRDQVHSFLARRNGLASNAVDPFIAVNLEEADEQRIRAAFLAHNPMNG